MGKDALGGNSGCIRGKGIIIDHVTSSGMVATMNVVMIQDSALVVTGLWEC